MSTAPIDLVLPQLRNVRQRQPGQWSACCPAHDDGGPSLSVRETSEGAVLLHCFAGCTVAEIVAAIGMNLSDLFPPRQTSGHEPKRKARLLTAGQALELLETETNFIAIAAVNLSRGQVLSEADLQRITQAAGRIHWLRAQSMGGLHA